MGCTPPIRLILLFTHSCQQQAFIKHPLYFTCPLWRWVNNSIPNWEVRCSPWKPLRNPVSPGGTANLRDLGTSLRRFPLIWQWGWCREMSGRLIRAADLCTRCARGRKHHSAFHPSKSGLAFIRTTWSNHVRHFEGKESKPACLPALSISFVLLLLMLLSRAHTWCSAEQMLWKGGSARRSRGRPVAWVLEPVTLCSGGQLQCEVQQRITPEEDQAFPSPSAPKPGPRELFLKCKSDQDNHELKNRPVAPCEIQPKPNCCLLWSMGEGREGVMVTLLLIPSIPSLQNLSQV